MTRGKYRRRGISILIEAVVVAIMVIASFAVAYYYTIPSSPRLQRSQADLTQTAYNILDSLAKANEFDNTIINGNAIVSRYGACSYSAPSISAIPAAAWASPGGSVTYDISLVNNDQYCGAELFILTITLPSSAWSYSVNQQSLVLASNGGSATVRLTVTSPTTIGDQGNFTVGVTVSNFASSAPVNKASASYNLFYVVSNTKQCVYQNPTLTIGPSKMSAPAGYNLSYSITIANNDQNCGLETFTLTARPLGNWSVTFSQPIVKVYSGMQGSVTAYLTSPKQPSPGSNNTLVTVSNAANPSFQSSAIIGYTVGGTGSCQSTSPSNPPGLSVNPTSYSGSSNINASYSVVITDNDVNGCPETVTLTVTINQQGWIASFSPSSVVTTTTVRLNSPPSGSKAQGGVTLYIIPRSNATINSVGSATITASNGKTSNATASFKVTSVPTCIRSPPSISITPPLIWGSNGTAESYIFSVTNNNNNYCDNGVSTFNLVKTLPKELTIKSLPSQLSIPAGQNKSVQVQVNSTSSILPGRYAWSITASDSSQPSNARNASAVYYIPPTCQTVTLSCLIQIGALKPNWQRNLDVALASIIPSGYVYNLTVYLVYTPPANPYNSTLIPLNNNIKITDATPLAFANAAQVVAVDYIYTTPSLYVLEFTLQLAEVTSP